MTEKLLHLTQPAAGDAGHEPKLAAPASGTGQDEHSVEDNPDGAFSHPIEVRFHKKLQQIQGPHLTLTRRQRGHIMGAFREVFAQLNKEK